MGCEGRGSWNGEGVGWEGGVAMVRGGWSWEGEGRGGWSWDMREGEFGW